MDRDIQIKGATSYKGDVVEFGGCRYPVYYMHLRDWCYGVVEDSEGANLVRDILPCGGCTIAYTRFSDSESNKSIREKILGEIDEKYKSIGGMFFDSQFNLTEAYGVTYCRTDEVFIKKKGREESLKRLREVLKIRKTQFIRCDIC